MPAVRIGKEVFENFGDESLLESGLRSSVPMAYSCKLGRCSSCRCRVISGETITLIAEEGLSESDKLEGWILSCSRAAGSDLVLDSDGLLDRPLPKVRTLPCKIAELERVSDSVLRVQLRLPPNSDFYFMPGQYVDIIVSGLSRRSYSIANFLREDGSLELHIRAVRGGLLSDYWFSRAKVGDLLRFSGPHGTFAIREVIGKDLIFLATGTGIAPVKAMLEGIMASPQLERPKSISVFWGGRCEDDLYWNPLEISCDFNYTPVLSRQVDWLGERGYVQDAFLRTGANLSECIVYACGSDSMISSARGSLVASGLSEGSFFSDAFVCSSDNPDGK